MFKNEGPVFFIGDFDESMESDLLVPLTIEIQKQKALKYGRIDLYINSFGGGLYLVQHLIELVELAKREDIVVRTMVMSAAYSAGSVLAITGTPGERYIARDAEHLIHYGVNGSLNTTPLQIERQEEFNRRMFRWGVNHYKKYSSVPDIEQHMADDHFFVIARNAIKWGLADKYLDKFDIGEYAGD
jgi:ATP-dependent protease ClpP protease subunit